MELVEAGYPNGLTLHRWFYNAERRLYLRRESKSIIYLIPSEERPEATVSTLLHELGHVRKDVKVVVPPLTSALTPKVICKQEIGAWSYAYWHWKRKFHAEWHDDAATMLRVGMESNNISLERLPTAWQRRIGYVQGA